MVSPSCSLLINARLPNRISFPDSLQAIFAYTLPIASHRLSSRTSTFVPLFLRSPILVTALLACATPLVSPHRLQAQSPLLQNPNEDSSSEDEETTPTAVSFLGVS